MINNVGTIQLLDSKQLYIEPKPVDTKIYDIRKAFPAESDLHYFGIVVFMANHLYVRKFEVTSLISMPLPVSVCQIQEIYIDDKLVGTLDPLNGKFELLDWVNCIDVLVLAYGDTKVFLQ